MPRALACVLATLAFVISPLFVPNFGGFTPAHFPVPQSNPPMQPAGYAFALWGLIYLWLLMSAVFGFLKRRADPAWSAMRPAYLLSVAVGTSWLPVAKLSPFWAIVLIWLMLISALVALFRSPRTDQFWASWPIGLYAGWLSAASVVALGLLSAGYGILSATLAAYLSVALACALGFVLQWRLGRVPSYGLAVIWALIAVAARNDFALSGVASLALTGAVLMIWPTFRAWRCA